MRGKVAAGERAAALVQDGMRLGLGTGSTAECFLEALARRIHSEGLQVAGVATSQRTEALARQLGVATCDFNRYTVLDLAVDGADEIGPRLALIKGGGGALLREKIVASAARELVIIATPEKVVRELGASFPLPIEVLPFAAPLVRARLLDLRLNPALRLREGQPVVTDNGNWIIDCRTGPIADPTGLDALLHGLPGVLETGLFLGLATRVLLGREDGTVVEEGCR